MYLKSLSEEKTDHYSVSGQTISDTTQHTRVSKQQAIEYTVGHPFSRDFVYSRAFLTCSTGRWADPADTVQPI